MAKRKRNLLPHITLGALLDMPRCSDYPNRKVERLWRHYSRGKPYLTAIDVAQAMQQSRSCNAYDELSWALCRFLPAGFMGYEEGRHFESYELDSNTLCLGCTDNSDERKAFFKQLIADLKEYE